ncbi:crAss001_48 related protein [Paucilactobacillus sp. N302-9]
MKATKEALRDLIIEQNDLDLKIASAQQAIQKLDFEQQGLLNTQVMYMKGYRSTLTRRITALRFKGDAGK